MSHFTVLVTGNDIDKALAPFIEHQCDGYEQFFKFIPSLSHEELQMEYETYCNKHKHDDNYDEDKYDSVEEWANEYHGYTREGDSWGYIENPNAKWDWYELGGRWSGMLKLKHSAEGVKGGQYSKGNRVVSKGYVDSALKSDIDWDAMHKEEKEKGLSYITPYFKAIIGKAIFTSWDDMREKHNGNIDLARELYHYQEAIKATKQVNKDDFYFNLEDVLKQCPSYKTIMNEPIFTKEIVETLIQEYGQTRADTAGHTFAVLHEGQWVERGEMGWFGIVNNEKDHDDWIKSFNAFLDHLPGDTRINIVDCHI